MKKEKIKQNPIILDLFKSKDLTQKNDGNYMVECPSCGLQGGRTTGLILFPETNSWFCHSSQKHGGILELIAIQNKIIKCTDCRDSGEKRRVLESEQFKEVMDILENTSEELYHKVLQVTGLKQEIQLPNDGILVSEFADQLGKRLKEENIFFFRPENREVVEIGKIKTSDGKYQYNGFITVDANRFVTIVERYFRPWQKVYTRTGGQMQITKSMPAGIANLVLVSDNFREQMPTVNRIFTVPIPIIYNNELIFPERGYDKRFGSWMSHNAPTISNPDMSLEEAKELLFNIHKEFPYQTKQDFTNAISRILTPFCRGLYKRQTCRTPLFVLRANRERAGKDYHEGITSILFEGNFIEDSPISNQEKGNNNEELRKKIMSAFMSGRKKLHFSNNKGFINNAVFESILTAENFSDRKLGSNNTFTFPNEMEFSISGNSGMTMTPDLANRSRMINLMLDIENANLRKFENPNLHEWVLNHRSEILSALFSLVKNWVKNGTPEGKLPFASYPEWSRVVGGIMESAGYESPCIQDKETLGISSDSETEDMKNLFELIYEKTPEKWLTKKEIADILIDSEDSLFNYIDWDNKSDQIKFGQKIIKFSDRILSEIKMLVKDRNVRTQRWEYKFTKNIPVHDRSNIFETRLVGEKIGHDGHVEDLTKKSNTEKIGHDGHVEDLTKKSNTEIFDNTNKLKLTIINKSDICEEKVGHDGHDGHVLQVQDLYHNINIYMPQTTIPQTCPTCPTWPEPSSPVETSQKTGETARDTQFFEDDCSKDIREKKIEVTPEQILEFIKINPQTTIVELHEKFGSDFIPIKNQLLAENKIVQIEGVYHVTQ